MQLQKDWWNL